MYRGVTADEVEREEEEEEAQQEKEYPFSVDV